MKVGIVGLGKIGACMMAAFAKAGHEVLGCDLREDPLGNISKAEEGFEEALLNYNLGSRVVPMKDVVEKSDIIFVVTATPSLGSGHFDDSWVEEALTECAAISPSKMYVVVSTVPLGTMDKLAKIAGSLYYNPSYTSLGKGIEGVLKTRFALIGAPEDDPGAPALTNFWKSVNKEVEVIVSDYRTIEVTKLVINMVMVSNISTINKFGEIYRQSGTDQSALSRVLTLDSRFRLESFKPGLGYGGPCLPRDNKAIQALCRDLKVDDALFAVYDRINEEQVQRALEYIKPFFRVGVIGVGYKPGTDLTIESQAWRLVEEARKAGKEVEVWDPYAKRLCTVSSPEEMEKKVQVVILALPYKVGIPHIKLWEA